MTQTYLKQLKLLQLVDTALPIGSTAHSFGLETLVADGFLTVAQLPAFFEDYLKEVGVLEASFCRAAYHIGQVADKEQFTVQWLNLNRRFSALKLARESRVASGKLGKRLLQLICALESQPALETALQTGAEAGVELHHALAFGLVGGVLALEEELTVLAYLQQNLGALISVCQRLLPLGQHQAATLLWNLKPSLVETAQGSNVASPLAGSDPETQSEEPVVYTFAPLYELAAMRHPSLSTRLFIS